MIKPKFYFSKKQANFFKWLGKEFLFLKILAYRIGILLILYFVLRLLFLTINLDHLNLISKSDVVKAFLIGIRFDLAAIVFFNAVIIILHLIPFSFRFKKKYQAIIKILFYLFNSLAFIIAISDLEYYKFNFKRIDVGSLGLLGTLPSLGNSFLVEFWHLIVIFLLFIVGSELLYRKKKISQFHYKLNLPFQTFIFLVGIGLSLIFLRGGIGVQIPMRSITAARGLHPELIPLATNSPFTFYRSLMSFKINERKYLPDRVAQNLYLTKTQYSDNKSNRKNVVIFLLESFSKIYVGSLNGSRKGYTPFLDSLMSEGLACTNGFSNGRRSNQGLVSVVSGIPPLMEVPYMYSSYAGNNQNSISSLLKEEGYSTAFFNGSNKEMLNWESYIYFSGFEKYFSREQYNNDKHHDGGWGIYDHYFLNYMVDELDNLPTPFCTSVLTLSSHHPYTVPKVLDGFRNKEIGPYLNSLKYADYALRKFFEKASKKSWFKNTLFVFTADHTAVADGISPDEKRKGRTAFQKNRIGLYSIPILFYQPNSNLKGKIDFPVQQIDIMPSVMDLLGYSKGFASFGESVFRGTPSKKYSFNYVNGVYQVLDKDNLLLFNGEAPVALYNYVQDSLLVNNIVTDSVDQTTALTNKIKAVIQTYHHTLINNKYFWNEQELGTTKANYSK